MWKEPFGEEVAERTDDEREATVVFQELDDQS